MEKNKIYSEVNSILNSLGEDYISKIPDEVYNVVLELKDDSYNPTININRSFEGQNISKEAIAMICNFHIKYWCQDAEEKERIKKILGSKSHKKDIAKNYIADDIDVENVVKEKGLVESKESFISKFLQWYLKL